MPRITSPSNAVRNNKISVIKSMIWLFKERKYSMEQSSVDQKKEQEVSQLELERFAQLLSELIKKYIDKIETENKNNSQ